MDQTFEQDHLTDAARDALRYNVQVAYSSVVPEGPDESAKPFLEKLSETGAVKQASDREMDRAVQSGLWLWHDFLDRSHTLSQAIETPEGSFWHGIMHRREGDFGNSKYWFRQVGKHPVYDVLSAKADDILRHEPLDKSLFAVTKQGWDPYAFIDLCQSVHESPSDSRYGVAVSLQQLEWRELFDHCVREARR